MSKSLGRQLGVALLFATAAALPTAGHGQRYNPVTQQAQTRLAALGHDPGTLDGAMGVPTRSAIRDYQRQSGLPETGNLDAATLERLGVGTSVALVGSVRDWAPLPTQAEIDRLLANPINDPRFPYTDYRPNAPGANIDVPGAAVLAAMNASADQFGSRRAGQPGHAARGFRAVNGCLRTGLAPTHWSDLMMHYYCQMSLATRTCYSAALAGRSTPAGRIYPRVEAYQGCANGTLPNAAAFAWAARNQPLVLQYLTFAQTNGFNHEQEQAVINAFYGISNPEDRAECRQKRPLRTEDPTDGTHCLVNKTMSVRLVGRSR